MLSRFFLCTLLVFSAPAAAQQAPVSEPPMSPQRLAAILLALDPEAAPTQSGIGLTIGDVPVLVVFDPMANRMRAMVPVASADGLTPEDLLRMMQANFDTALDARYAVANGRLWSVFIHPLRELQRDQLISGLVQTVTLAQTYGSLYSSTDMSFGSGDSRSLLEELQERGEEL